MKITKLPTSKNYLAKGDYSNWLNNGKMNIVCDIDTVFYQERDFLDGGGVGVVYQAQIDYNELGIAQAKAGDILKIKDNRGEVIRELHFQIKSAYLEKTVGIDAYWEIELKSTNNV